MLFAIKLFQSLIHESIVHSQTMKWGLQTNTLLYFMDTNLSKGSSSGIVSTPILQLTQQSTPILQLTQQLTQPARSLVCSKAPRGMGVCAENSRLESRWIIKLHINKIYGKTTRKDWESNKYLFIIHYFIPSYYSGCWIQCDQHSSHRHRAKLSSFSRSQRGNVSKTCFFDFLLIRWPVGVQDSRFWIPACFSRHFRKHTSQCPSRVFCIYSLGINYHTHLFTGN